MSEKRPRRILPPGVREIRMVGSGDLVGFAAPADQEDAPERPDSAQVIPLFPARQGPPKPKPDAGPGAGGR